MCTVLLADWQVEAEKAKAAGMEKKFKQKEKELMSNNQKSLNEVA